MSNITSILTDLHLSSIARTLNGVGSIEIYMLYAIGGFGILTNLFTIFCLIIIRTFRTKHSCFLFHHCLIGLTESILCIPFAMSYFMNQKNSPEKMIIHCDSLGHIHLACVTAQVLNIVAMVALEAYRFEDLLHHESTTSLATSTSAKTQQDEQQLYHAQDHHHHNQPQRKSSVFKSTISCSCLIFGIVIIWCSSIILHLGITWIGSEAKIYYHTDHRYCNFIIREERGYVLYLMWIIITLCSLIITIRYIRKVYVEVKQKRKKDAPLLSLSIIKGVDIANKALIMQQILQRITAYNVIIALFIFFWFPLFIVTLCDTKFHVSAKLLRILLLIAWSNSSFSPLCYTLLIPKFSDLCLPCIRDDKRNQYDTMKSYYNRVGDRFHDLGMWEEHQREKQKQIRSQRHRFYRSKKSSATTTSAEDDESEMMELNRLPKKTFIKKKQQHQYSNRRGNKLMNNTYRRPNEHREFLNTLPTIVSTSTPPSSSPTFKRTLFSDSSRTTTHQPQSSPSQHAQITRNSSTSSTSSVSSLTNVTPEKHHYNKAESIRYQQPRRIPVGRQQQHYTVYNQQQPYHKKRLIHSDEQQRKQQLSNGLLIKISKR